MQIRNKQTTHQKTKLTIYKTLVRATMIHAAETVTLTQRQGNLRIAQRKIMGITLGLVKMEDNEYKTRSSTGIRIEGREN